MSSNERPTFEVCDRGADVDTVVAGFAADVEAYYARLHEQLTEVPEEERPEDRMFM